MISKWRYAALTVFVIALICSFFDGVIGVGMITCGLMFYIVALDNELDDVKKRLKEVE